MKPIVAWLVRKERSDAGTAFSAPIPVTADGEHTGVDIQYPDGTISLFNSFYKDLAEAQAAWTTRMP
jgi:hypothetical protein